MNAVRRFTAQEDGALLGRFEPIEADLLRLATKQLLEMLDSGSADPELAESDGIFARLLPDAYRDDDEAAAEFRRYTSVNLLERKALNAQIVINTLGLSAGEEDAAAETDTAATDTEHRQPITIRLAPDAVQAWLRSLTDLRLTLADRLQISPDGVVHLATEDTPFLRELYDWLGMLQEELVYSIDV
ncbi:DUF2017 family protein [Cryobacterium sp. Y50]|uniref:DUF2017 family protein n=1 Tax=Cryobacterium sp. Y50 TaxID=2048286 RepID=UPI000CE2BF9A|nr:DUF2017 family protein [Cryobacterium sp. Y50]